MMKRTVEKSVKLNLVGLDGNAFSLLWAFSRAARKQGWTKEEIDAVLHEAMSDDSTLIVHCDEEQDDNECRLGPDWPPGCPVHR